MESTGFPKAPSKPTGELLSLAQVVERYGVSQWLVYKWANEGKLHVVPVGKPGAAGRTRFKYPDWEVAEILSTLYSTLRVA